MRPNERANIARCAPDECVSYRPTAHGLTTEEDGDVPMQPEDGDVPMQPTESSRANIARCAPDEYVRVHGLIIEEYAATLQ